MTLKHKFPQVRRAAATALDEGLGELAQFVKARRDPLTPVDTGDLLASGKVERTGEAEWVVSEGEGIGDARAAFTEFGTSKQAAQPHMIPAAREGAQAMPRIVGNKVAKAIKGAAL
jgi:HK97 gp10 family phage protein